MIDEILSVPVLVTVNCTGVESPGITSFILISATTSAAISGNVPTASFSEEIASPSRISRLFGVSELLSTVLPAAALRSIES